MNHEYLETGGGRRENGLKCTMRLRNTTYSTPQQLWSGLISRNRNIVCVLCGHVDSMYAVTWDVNIFGDQVLQLEHNIQYEPYCTGNWLMLWEFPASGDMARVSVYEVSEKRFEGGDPCIVSFRYR